MDFFTVPTATFRVLFVFLVLSHDRRRILHWNITEHPTEEWTVQQLREAFPWDEAPRYLIRDRDAIFGRETAATIKGMGTEAVVTAARSPWQNPFVERLIDPFAASVWITSSSGTRVRCTAFCKTISNITRGHARTFGIEQRRAGVKTS